MISTGLTGLVLGDRCYLAFFPRYWPRTIRRLFLILLPLALVLWAVLVLAIMAASLVKAAARPVAHFWNAPRRVRLDYCYDYERGSAGLS